MNEDGYSTEVLVDLVEIDEALRPASEMRVALNQEAIEGYAEDFDKLPPILLVFDASTGKHWVPDGGHRCTAARMLKKKRIKARVKSGTYLDAFHDACRANERNGVRVTNADKRHRVLQAIELAIGKGKSTQSIADLCAVTRQYAGKLLEESGRNNCDLADPSSGRIIGKDGKSYPARKPKKDKPAKVEKPKNPRLPVADGGSAAPPAATNGLFPRIDDEPAEEAPDAPEEAPESFDVMGLWREEEDYIMCRYRAWPEDARGTFVLYLLGLGSRLRHRFHPDIEDLTHLPLV